MHPSLCSALAPLWLLSGWTAGPLPPAAEARGPQAASRPEPGEARRMPRKMSAVGVTGLLGQHVAGRDGERLGTLHDLVIERSTGRASYAVIAAAGEPRGSAELDLVAQPFESVRWDPETGGLCMQASAAQLRALSPFSREGLSELPATDRVPSPRTQAVAPPAAPAPGGVARAAERILASDVVTRAVTGGGRALGRVSELVLVRPQRLVAFVLVEDGEARVHGPCIVPWTALTPDAEGTLALPTAGRARRDPPRLSPDGVAELGRADLFTAVHRFYGVDPPVARFYVRGEPAH